MIQPNPIQSPYLKYTVTIFSIILAAVHFHSNSTIIISATATDISPTIKAITSTINAVINLSIGSIR